jgi:hypothetical protein
MSLVAAVVALGVAPGKLLSVVDSSLSTQLKMYRSDSRASVKDKVFREQQVGSDSVVQANTVAVVSDQDKAQAL